AVELGVSVLDNVASHDEHVYRVVIRRGVLKAHYVHVQQTTYTFNNKSDVEQTVYLDHPRSGSEWKLFDSPAPHEITENYCGFQFPLPAKATTPFVVRQRKLLHQHHSLADLKDQQLAFWLEQKYVDAKVEKVLHTVIELRQKAADREAALANLEKE